jgi:hypothetical protein
MDYCRNCANSIHSVCKTCLPIQSFCSYHALKHAQRFTSHEIELIPPTLTERKSLTLKESKSQLCSDSIDIQKSLLSFCAYIVKSCQQLKICYKHSTIQAAKIIHSQLAKDKITNSEYKVVKSIALPLLVGKEEINSHIILVQGLVSELFLAKEKVLTQFSNSLQAISQQFTINEENLQHFCRFCGIEFIKSPENSCSHNATQEPFPRLQM